MQKIIYISIEYIEVMYHGLILAQIWQKLENIKFLTKKQF